MLDILLRLTMLSAAACVLSLLGWLVYLLFTGPRYSERVIQLVFWLIVACLAGPVGFVVGALLHAVFIGG